MVNVSWSFGSFLCCIFLLARKRRPNFNYFVAFDDDVPEKCMPQALAKINTVYMRQKLKEMQQVVISSPSSSSFLFLPCGGTM